MYGRFHSLMRKKEKKKKRAAHNPQHLERDLAQLDYITVLLGMYDDVTE